MKTLIKHRPFTSNYPFTNGLSLFNELLGDSPNAPMVNVKETDTDFNLEVSAPGYKKDNFDINVENNTLTISNSIEDEKSEDTENYTRREFYKSSFSRSFTLPKNANSDDIKATYEDGILKLSIPKSEPVKKSKQIKIG